MTPEFYIEPHVTDKGSVRLMVKVGDEVRNIWALPQSVATKEVLAAVECAFEIGSLLTVYAIQKSTNDARLLVQTPCGEWGYK